MIRTDEQMLLAQQNVANLRQVLLQARKVHSPQDYSRLAQPILLEIQRREQEILDFLSADIGSSSKYREDAKPVEPVLP